MSRLTFHPSGERPVGWRTKRTVVLPDLPDHKEWLGVNSASPRPPYRFWCVVSKFPSQKNGNREEHKKVGMTQGAGSCHLDFLPSHGQLPWHSALLGAASEAWSFQKVDYVAVSLRPCWLTSVSVNRAICPLMPQLENFLSMSSLLKKDVYFVVITA